MKKAYFLLSFSWLIWMGVCGADAQIYDTNVIRVRTFAGSGQTGDINGLGTHSMFYYPSPLVADDSGILFALEGNGLIRKILPSGAVSTLNFSLSTYALTVDHSGTLWAFGNFSPQLGNLIEIQEDGTVTQSELDVWTWSAGNGGGDGLCVDSSNRIYIAGQDNKIYRYNTVNTNLEVFAGSGNQGSVDGNWIFSSFSMPSALAIDQHDNVYVWDRGSHLIRKINQNRDVVTIAGKSGVAVDVDGSASQASFNAIVAMRVDNDSNLVLACGTSIRKMSPDTNTVTIAGNFSHAGFVDGLGASARFNGANGISVSKGLLFVSDLNNNCIRIISFNAVPEQVAATNLTVAKYPALTLTGTVGRSYEIQSSRELNLWQPEASLLLNSSSAFWVDTNAFYPQKFYRGASLPRK